MQLIKIILVSCVLCLGSLQAQAQMAQGHVYAKDGDTKVPLMGANVYWLGTTEATSTDSVGYFHLMGKGNDSGLIVVSFVGYKSDTLKAGESKMMKIFLTENSMLDGVTITEEQRGTKINSISTINQQEITQKELKKAACCNLSESFETNPTVDVMYADAVTGAKEIRLLGLDGTYSQLMTENVPTIRGLASTYGLTYIPGPWLESIQVSKGAGSVVNGYESMTGQINAEYKKPNEAERLNLNVYVNHLGRVEGNLVTAKQFNAKVGTALFVSGNFFGTKTDANHDHFLDIPLVTQYNVMNRWRFDPDDHWEIQLVVKGLYEDRTGGQWAFKRNVSVFDQSAFGVKLNTKRLEGFMKTGYVWHGALTKSIGWINNVSYHDQEGWYGRKQYIGKETNWYSNLIFQANIRNPKHTLKAGASFMLDDYKETFNSLPYNRRELVPGIFTEYAFNYQKRYSLLAGLRADYHNLYGVFVSPRIHLKYDPTDQTTIRLSGGRGYRVANIFAENTAVLISARDLNIQQALKPEIAWNFGLDFTQRFTLAKRSGSFTFDVYHTRFENEVIMDLDAEANKVLFYNLNGKSFSTSVQAEVYYEPVKGLEVKASYKFNDVRTSYQGVLQKKLLVPSHKGLLNVAYTTKNKHWKFDATGQITGTSIVASSYSVVTDGQVKNNHSPIFPTVNTQVTFIWKKWEVYVGAENLTGFIQKTPIIGADQPFSNGFDASSIWGPIYGRIFYTGMRFTFK